VPPGNDGRRGSETPKPRKVDFESSSATNPNSYERLHLDLVVSDSEAEIAQLIGLRSHSGREFEEDGARWIALTDRTETSSSSSVANTARHRDC
jgi:hypothetical protein